MQNRFKSKVLWLSIASLIVSSLITLNVVSVAESEQFNVIIANVLDVLALLGILNNPTDKTNW